MAISMTAARRRGSHALRDANRTAIQVQFRCAVYVRSGARQWLLNWGDTMIYRSRGEMGIVVAPFLASGGQLASFCGHAAEAEPPVAASPSAEPIETIKIAVTGSRIPPAFDTTTANATH